MSLPTNNKSAMLTIDWDYFVPEDPIHDFGHMENLFFLDQIWWFRVQYIDNIKTSGEELVFWNRLREKNIFPIDQVWVSDSHLPAYDIADLYNIDTIVSVDAHHDVWDLKETEKGCEVDCGSWARYWLHSEFGRELLWVPSPTGTDDPETKPDGFAKIDLGDLSGWEFPVVHICRSGCWTPPWLDQKFIDFVGSGKFGKVITKFPNGCDTSWQDEPWNPIKIRWTPDEINGARELDYDMRAREAAFEAEAKKYPCVNKLEV